MSVLIGKRTYEVLNKQIAEEFYSSYLYLAMSSVLSTMGLDGCAKWMEVQAEEERGHGMKMYQHMLQRGVKVKFMPIAAPKQDWRSPLHIFEEMLRHEQHITSLIFAIYEAAVADKDYASMSFIKYFIDEQVEEENVANALLEKLKKMQTSEMGIMLFDAELGKRK